MSIFASVLAGMNQPEPVVKMIDDKLSAAVALIRENNSRVAKINEAKNTDPNNTEYLDAVWARVAAEESDPEIVAAEKRYEKARAAAEKELLAMRDAVKARHIGERLSEEAIQKLRKSVNDGKEAISDAVKSAQAFAEMADQFLLLAGNSPKDKTGAVVSVITLLPEADSLLNVRGRKAASGNSGGEGAYATRISDAYIDGKRVFKEVKNKKTGVMEEKAHFNYLAIDLSKRFNEGQFPENQVTALEIEEAYYRSASKEFRVSADMPETHEFTFEKSITVQVPNSDEKKSEPHKVVISVTRWTAPKTETTETAKAEGTENASTPETTPAAAQ